MPLARGQLTVLVPERDARRAHDVLGTRPAVEREPGLMFRVIIGLVVLALVFSIFAVVMTVAR